MLRVQFDLTTKRSPRFWHAYWCTAVAAVMCVLSQGAVAQSLCDPAVPQNEAQASGYRQRNDRCEGKYKRDVASFGVQLVSLMGSVPFEDLCTQGQAVHLVWPAHAGASSKPVHLQVESLRPTLEYRLNTARPARSSSYEWPREPRCSNDIQLRSSEVALIARSESSIGSTPTDVLLPVALAAQPTVPVRPPYRAVLVAGRRIHELYVSLWYYEDATNRTEIMLDRPLRMRPYPSGGKIPVELSAADVRKPGLYRLLISVEFESGQTEAIERYFIGE